MSLLDSMRNRNSNTGNPIFDMFGNLQNFQQQFNQFSSQIYQQGQNPQQIVQNLLNSGRMSQDQFNKFSQIASMLTGKRQF